MSSPFKVRLTMLSDWHVGTGAGRPGSVDSLLARDADDFPFVPAKTINGIWRDAMETLTLGLDDGSEGAWSKWVEKIFGIQPNQIDAAGLGERLKNDEDTYSFSVLTMQPARLSQNLRAKIDEAVNKNSDEEERKRQRRKILSALTFIKPGVAIDEQTGAAITDFLRFEEMGRVGTVLEAECRLNFGKIGAEAQQVIGNLLLLSTKLVERIGGKRRRGAGLCAMRVSDENGNELDAQAAINWLNENGNAPSIPASSQQDEIFSLDKATMTDQWQTLEFSLRLQTPVSIVTATLGNVSESLDYIPGTYLLPHITKVLRRKLSDKVFPAVAYGDLQVLPATIEIKGARGLPVPRALAQHKVEGGFEQPHTLYNKFAAEKETDKQLKPFRGGYVQALESVGDGTNEKLPAYKNTPKTLLMHNTIKDEIQRPHEDVGGVYSREAVAAGTALRGEVRLKKSLAGELDANWWHDLNGAVRLGTSRKDDYGLAAFELKQDKEGKPLAPKAFEPTSQLNSKDNKRLTVYFSSDCLLRNSNLRQTNLAESLAAELSRSENLNVSLKIIRPTDKETTAVIHTRRIESWHEGWGFPRPTLIALAAGSCVVFEVTNGRVTLDALQKVEAAGIGERRGEGYGQVRFNPPLLTRAINDWQAADKPEEVKSPVNGGDLNDEEQKFARLIEETAWREELKVAVLKVASMRKEREKIFGLEIEGQGDAKHGIPPMSQVGGLRSVISRLQRHADAELVVSWLDHLKQTDNRRKKWSEDKEKAKKKLDDIKKLVTNKETVWKFLQEARVNDQPAWKPPVTLTERNLQADERLWAEAVRALFDACARAHKRELEKKEGN